MIKQILEQIDKTSNILKKEFPNTPFKLSENKDYIALAIFVVKFKDRRNGIGTKFMKRLIELAKESEKDIFITPTDDYSEETDMDKEELIKWYEKLGFEKKHSDDHRSKNTYCYYIK